MKIIDKLVNKNLQLPNHFFSTSKEVATARPIITISREKGAGGRIIAFKLAEILGPKWKVYHRDLVDRIAADSHKDKARVREIDEKDVDYFDDLVEELFGEDYLSLNQYHQSLIRILSSIGNQGYAIIVGRGANFLFKDAFKIRIIADRQQRIDWLMKYEDLSKEKAGEIIQRSDQERAKFTEYIFGKDINDPENYDLILKTSHQLTSGEAADFLARLAKYKFEI